MEEGRREKGRLLPTDNRHRLFLWSLERKEERRTGGLEGSALDGMKESR